MYDRNDPFQYSQGSAQGQANGASNQDAAEAARAKIAALGEIHPTLTHPSTSAASGAAERIVAPGSSYAPYPQAPQAPLMERPYPPASAAPAQYPQAPFRPEPAPAQYPQPMSYSAPAPTAYHQAPAPFTPAPTPLAPAAPSPVSPLSDRPRGVSPLSDKYNQRQPLSALEAMAAAVPPKEAEARHKPAPHQAKKSVPNRLRPLAIAAGIFLLAVLLTKSPVILSQLRYSNTPAPSVATVPAAVVSPEPTISIPKINVNAPVVYEKSIIEEDVQRALQGGVVHYGTTAKPGEKGNTVIFGHSSNDWWEPGDYKFVFVLLDKLAPGDKITVNYESRRYTYEVTGSKVVEPTDVGVLNPTSEPTLTLITCTPPGTAWKRLVVTAKQIDPAPATAATASKTTTSAPQPLPGQSEKPGFGEQLIRAWQDFTAIFQGRDEPQPSRDGSPGLLPAIK